jgi:hypothetical protein
MVVACDECGHFAVRRMNRRILGNCQLHSFHRQEENLINEPGYSMGVFIRVERESTTVLLVIQQKLLHCEANLLFGS